jgi:hypothetical protein
MFFISENKFSLLSSIIIEEFIVGILASSDYLVTVSYQYRQYKVLPKAPRLLRQHLKKSPAAFSPALLLLLHPLFDLGPLKAPVPAYLEAGDAFSPGQPVQCGKRHS